MQGRLIYTNSPILENLLLDGQEEVANVRTPITSAPTPATILLDPEYQPGLQPLHWAQKQTGYNNMAGIKPTVGLTSRARGTKVLINVSTMNQDTVDPMTR